MAMLIAVSGVFDRPAGAPKSVRGVFRGKNAPEARPGFRNIIIGKVIAGKV